MNLEDLVRKLQAQNVHLSKRKISQKRNLLVEKELLVSFFWFGRVGFHYDITTEIICDYKTRDWLMKIFSEFPLIQPMFKSNRRLILFFYRSTYRIDYDSSSYRGDNYYVSYKITIATMYVKVSLIGSNGVQEYPGDYYDITIRVTRLSGGTNPPPIKPPPITIDAQSDDYLI